MVAAGYGRGKIVELLLAAGADVNARSNAGATPLMVAAELGYGKVVRLLLKAGADVNAKNGEGQTALDVAEYKIVPVLRDAGGKKSCDL